MKSILLQSDYLFVSQECNTLKNSTNLGMSFADSAEFIFLPCFSEMLIKSSLAPASKLSIINCRTAIKRSIYPQFSC